MFLAVSGGLAALALVTNCGGSSGGTRSGLGGTTGGGTGGSSPVPALAETTERPEPWAVPVGWS